MEVLSEKVAMLSNYEVLKLLESDKLTEHKVSNVATIAYETEKYLERTPCKEYSDEVIHDFLMAVAPYEFTRAEKLQILNLRPTSIVEIQLIIEELDERLKTEEELEKLINIIQRVLPDKGFVDDDIELQDAQITEVNEEDISEVDKIDDG